MSSPIPPDSKSIRASFLIGTEDILFTPSDTVEILSYYLDEQDIDGFLSAYKSISPKERQTVKNELISYFGIEELQEIFESASEKQKQILRELKLNSFIHNTQNQVLKSLPTKKEEKPKPWEYYGFSVIHGGNKTTWGNRPEIRCNKSFPMNQVLSVRGDKIFFTEPKKRSEIIVNQQAPDLREILDKNSGIDPNDFQFEVSQTNRDGTVTYIYQQK